MMTQPTHQEERRRWWYASQEESYRWESRTLEVGGGGGGIDDGLLRIFLHLLDVKEKNEGGGYRRERNFVYSKSEEESREEGRRWKRKPKSIQGLFLLLHFRVLNNNTHNLTEEGKKEEKVEEKGGALEMYNVLL